MSTIATPDRFTTLPDESVIASAVTALEEHGFSVEVVDNLDAARQAVLARIPPGSSVMTNTSVTLDQAGIADAINDGERYDSARNRMFALDFATQAQEMKAIGGQPGCSRARWRISAARRSRWACTRRATSRPPTSRRKRSSGRAGGRSSP